MSPLERFKLLAGITDDSQDGLITALLSDAADSVCDYIGRDEVPARLVSVQVQRITSAARRANPPAARAVSPRASTGSRRSFWRG